MSRKYGTGMSEDDFFSKIQTETALNSIQLNLNEAFADLEISLLDDDKDRAKQLYAEKQRSIAAPADNVIDVTPIMEESKVKVNGR